MNLAPSIQATRKSRFDDLERARRIRDVLTQAVGVGEWLPVLEDGRVFGIVHGDRLGASFWPCDHATWEKRYAGWQTYNNMRTDVQQLGKVARLNAYKTDTTLAAGWLDMWPINNNPDGGTYGGTAATARQFDDQTAGAIQFHYNPGGTATMHFLRALFSSNTAAAIQHILLYDRVLSYDAEVISTTTTTMTNVLTAQRYVSSGQPGLAICATATTGTAIGATASNLTTLNYTDNEGNAAVVPTDTTINWATSFTAATSAIAADVCLPFSNAQCYGPFIPLAPGDTGVRKIVDYTSSANNTGQVAFVLMRPLGWLPAQTGATAFKQEFGRNILALERIYAGACLGILSRNSSNSTLIPVTFDIAWGG